MVVNVLFVPLVAAIPCCMPLWSTERGWGGLRWAVALGGRCVIRRERDVATGHLNLAKVWSGRVRTVYRSKPPSAAELRGAKLCLVPGIAALASWQEA